MKLKWILLLIIVTFALASCQAEVDNFREKPVAKHGVMDLSRWDFEKDGIIPLKGEWELYWGKLFTPLDFILKQERTGWIDLPESWNGYPLNGKQLSGDGYATFRLRLTSLDSSQKSLKILKISTAYKLWIDDKLMVSVGTVGTNKESSEAQYLPKIIVLPENKQSVQLTVQVSNFHHIRGGIWKSIEMGTMQQLVQRGNIESAIDTFLFFGLIILGIYHLALYSLRKEDKSPLYLAIFCFIMSTRTLLVGQMYWYQLFPRIPWEYSLKIEYIGFYIGLPASVMYVYHLYSAEMSSKFRFATQLIGILFASIVLLTPAKVYTQTKFIFQAITAVVCVYIIYVIIKAVIRKREGALLLLVGLTFYVITIFNDILYYDEYIAVGDLSPFGLLIMILIQGFILSLKYTRTFRTVEVMTDELKRLNSGLEERIKERTVELEQSYRELEKINDEMSRMETSRKHLLSNISHDLGTPMTLIQGYVEALVDGVVTEKGQQRKYLELIHARVLGMNRLIADLFQLSKLEARQINFNFAALTLESFIAMLYNRYELEVKNKGCSLELYTPVSFDMFSPPPCVNVDWDRMDQVFTNLIFNAIKHTPKGGTIRLHVEIEDAGDPIHNKQAIIKVIDNGSGIAEEDLPYVFDRLYMKEKSRNSSIGGSGLGLAIVKEIVESHGGGVWAESEIGQGSTFCFTLPLH